MNDILRPSGENPGGIQKLEVTPFYAVASFPEIDNCEISTDLTFKTGFRWFFIECVENSLNYECEVKETDSGVIYNVKVSGVVRGDDLSIKRMMNEMMAINSFFLKTTDNTGMTVLVGYGQETCKFGFKKKSGDGMPGLRSYAFTFEGDFTNDPPMYNL